MAEGELSRADRRRLRRRAIEERLRRHEERDAFLHSSLESGERVLVRRRDHPLVTERRILVANQLRLPPRRGEWVATSIPFEEITRWSLGRLHDGRPLVDLEHEPVTGIERGPAHRFLWLRWGDAETLAVRTTTRFGFSRDSDPVLVAIRAELDRRRIPHGPAFEIRPAGTRAERLRGDGQLVGDYQQMWIRPALWRVTDVVYRGRLAWPVRVLSWTIVAVPAWFIAPWLIVPAIFATELAWITFSRWSWRREQVRQRI